MAFSMVSLVSGRGGSRNVRMPSICHLPASLVLATARERMPRRPRSMTFQLTRFATSSESIWGYFWVGWLVGRWGSWLQAGKRRWTGLLLSDRRGKTSRKQQQKRLTSMSLRMMWGAPLVVLKTLPSGPRRVPSVRLMVGSKGRKSICSWSLSSSRLAEVRTRVSRASRGGSFHLAARAAALRMEAWVSPGRWGRLEGGWFRQLAVKTLQAVGANAAAGIQAAKHRAINQRNANRKGSPGV